MGDVDNTTLPVPVDEVTPVPPLATGKVPDTPEARGKFVAFVNTTALGIPKAGVVKVGDVDRTRFPDPVDDVTPVPPFETVTVPEILLAFKVGISSATNVLNAGVVGDPEISLMVILS